MPLLTAIDTLSQLRARLYTLMATIRGLEEIDENAAEGIREHIVDLIEMTNNVENDVRSSASIPLDSVPRVTRYDSEPGEVRGPTILRDTESDYVASPESPGH